jgi:hypothetical protein
MPRETCNEISWPETSEVFKTSEVLLFLLRLRLHPRQYMIMRGHQAVGQHIHMRAQVFSDAPQEIQIILTLEEHGPAVVAAVVEMVILLGQEGRFPAGHGTCQVLDFRSL